jgi:hypothetical protein
VNPTAARWFALCTGFLAVVAVCMMVQMGLRLHRTRTSFSHLQHMEGCLPAAPEKAP